MKTIKKEMQTHLVCELNYIHIKNDIYVYKHIAKETSTKTGKTIGVDNSQWFCSKSDIDSFDASREFKPSFNFDNLSGWYSAENLSYIRPHVFSEIQMINLMPGRTSFWETQIKNPFDEILENPKLKNNVLLFSSYDNSVFYLDQKPYPSARFFNYMNGHIHDGKYDLEKVLDILSKNKNVEIHSEIKDEYIQDIPYYNSSENHSKNIEFTWHPTKNQAQEIYDYRLSKKQGCSYDDYYVAIFELDILKLRKARYFDDYYSSKEY